MFPKSFLMFQDTALNRRDVGYTANAFYCELATMQLQPARTAAWIHMLGAGIVLGTVVAGGSYLLLPRGLWADVLILLALAGLGIFWAVHDYRSLWLMGVALVPFSIEIILPPGTAALAVPTEPIAIAVMGIVLLGTLHNHTLRPYHVRHPLWTMMMLYWLWMLLCCAYATDPLRALKYWLSTTWLLAMFVWLPVVFLRDDGTRWHTVLALTLPLVTLVAYTLFNHGRLGFTFLSSSAAMQPFFKDHGAYATQLAACLAWPALLAWHAKTNTARGWWVGVTLLILTGIVFSYTRGAWLGALFAAGALAWLAWLRRQPRAALTVLIVGVVLMAFLLWQAITDLEEGSRKQDKTLGEHFTSILNTQRNASNQERILRWDAALQMMRARPITGFGPGCYSEQYAPYQQSRLRTSISTNRGDLGGAHNEFLSAGAEMGVPGLLLVLGLYLAAIALGVRGYLRSPNAERRMLYAGALAAVLSYLPHAFINNFMDQDKVAAPVYLAFAFIIALDVSAVRGNKVANYQNTHAGS